MIEWLWLSSTYRYTIFKFLFNFWQISLNDYRNIRIVHRSAEDISVHSSQCCKKNLSLEQQFQFEVITVPYLKILSKISVPSSRESLVLPDHSNTIVSTIQVIWSFKAKLKKNSNYNAGDHHEWAVKGMKAIHHMTFYHTKCPAPTQMPKYQTYCWFWKTESAPRSFHFSNMSERVMKFSNILHVF